MNYDDQFTGRRIYHLQQEIRDREDDLALKKAELTEKRAQVHDLVLVTNAMQSNINMLKGLLMQANEAVFGNDEALALEHASDSGQQAPSRSPMEMLRPQFKGMQLGDIVELVLDNSQQPLTITEIGRIIYDSNDKEEFARARNSLSAELRSGATKTPARWIKKGRSAYAPITFQAGVEAEVELSQTVEGGDAHAS